MNENKQYETMTKIWWKHRLSYQGRTVDALALEADEGRY